MRRHYGSPHHREIVALTPSLTDLDDRRPFDAAILANHAGGRSGLTRHSNGYTRIGAAGGVPAIAEAIANLLVDASNVRVKPKGGLRAKKPRELLIKLAVLGRELTNELEDELGPLAEAQRIQIVSARSAWHLPLEATYSREAPDTTPRSASATWPTPRPAPGRAPPRTTRGGCARTPSGACRRRSSVTASIRNSIPSSTAATGSWERSSRGEAGGSSWWTTRSSAQARRSTSPT
jgi:hypothetical protein